MVLSHMLIIIAKTLYLVKSVCEKATIELKKKIIIHFFSFQPPAKGAFIRGSGMDLSTGRFTAPITGIYQFSANVHIGKSN